MNFEQALTLMKEGKALRREGWKDPQCIATLEAGHNFQKVVKCQVAYYTHVKLGWHPTRNDILATDWELV